MRRFTNDYNPDGKEARRRARARAGFRCIRCNSPSVKGKILTTHHFDGDKSNDSWWNLLALCQVCHLKIQAKVDPEQPFMFEHSDWAKPYVAGFYANRYFGLQLTRDEVEYDLEWLALIEQRIAHGTSPTIQRRDYIERVRNRKKRSKLDLCSGEHRNVKGRDEEAGKEDGARINQG